MKPLTPPAPQPPKRLDATGKLRAKDVQLADQGTGNLPPGVPGRRETRTAEQERMGGLSEDRLQELQAQLTIDLSDAIDYIDEEVGEGRAIATNLYKGGPLGNEEPGRSRFVTRDVHDTVHAVLPSLMRIFTGGEDVVEYEPTGPEDEAQAKQATEYINRVVVQQDNEGFREFHSAFKDALIRDMGVWKWWWEEKLVLAASDHEGLSDEDLQALSEDEEVEKVEAELESEEGILPKVWKARVHRRRDKGRARFKALPGEEFLFDRRATCLEDATVIAHRAPLRVKDVVAMGYDRDEVLEHAGQDLDEAPELYARRPSALEWGDEGASDDLRPVVYLEAFTYFRLSSDEKDPVQLVKVCGLGSENFHVLAVEPVDEIPFAVISPDPEAHEMIGQGFGQKIGDIQYVKSAIVRGTLDSLTQSINPRTEIVDGQVNMDDLLNNELGGVVRVEGPGMMREIKTSFVGGDTLPVLEYFDQVKEERSKQSRASQGLDADALQSTTKAAVSATITGAQAQTELIARTFAETGVKRLFKGLLRLTIRHQDRPRMVRLRNEWVEVDPRHWNAEMDVRVNVAIGAGTEDQKIATLMAVKETQEGILQQLGPDNPLVSLGNYRHTLGTILELSGWKNTQAFFKVISEQEGAGGPPADPNSDPAKMLADAQKMEIEVKAQTEREKLALEREKMMMEDARERYKIAVEAQTKIAIAEVQHQADINEQAVTQQVEAMRLAEDERIRAYEADQAANAQIEQEQIAAQQAASQPQGGTE